jgi:hypothetical protein
MQSGEMMGKIVRILVVICLFSIGAGILAFVAISTNAGDRDFIGYWAAGKQLVHRASPYDSAAILHIERSAGYTGDWPNVSLDLPAAFFLVLPLGLVGAKTGLALWLAAFVACLIESIRMLWILNGRPENSLHLLAFLFAPVLVCLDSGQLGAFLLLGVVLFLYFHQSRPFLAGAALLLCSVKPHLFLPIGIVLLAWALDRKAYRVLAGFATALGASCALSFLFDAHAWREYSWMMSHNPGIQRASVPTLSVLFRLLVDPNAVWLQYVPAAAACAWALWYFWTRRARWNWMDQGMLLLLVSEVCAPHAWFTDEVMVLPAILTALYRAENSRLSLLIFCLLTGIALFEFFADVSLVSRFYLWTAPAWLAWYLLARASTGKEAMRPPAVPA